jgi:hypothetical protein
MINVWGDSIGAGVVAHLSKKEIEDFENSKRNGNESSDIFPPFKDDAVNKAYEKDDDITAF